MTGIQKGKPARVALRFANYLKIIADDDAENSCRCTTQLIALSSTKLDQKSRSRQHESKNGSR